jgi:hypothetical protein
MEWSEVLEYYQEHLSGWSGPVAGRGAKPDQKAASWTKDGRELRLEETEVIQEDLNTSLGSGVKAYGLGVSEVRK